eukprot:628458-Rhodomonas_salina.1
MSSEKGRKQERRARRGEEGVRESHVPSRVTCRAESRAEQRPRDPERALRIGLAQCVMREERRSESGRECEA